MLTIGQHNYHIANMTSSEFIELVRRMREAQNNYFRTRNVEHLKKSKTLESQVDSQIRIMQGFPL